jgi:hypothetical protein
MLVHSTPLVCKKKEKHHESRATFRTITTTTLSDIELPQYLMGSFRRKSITFFNGMTDEKTIVYWFQSKSFSIDLRLVDGNNTSIYQRQGWIGDTIWDAKTELLSWHIKHNYQNHVQWPEPAKLYQIGNSILEFSPSNAYVEDWRQQAKKVCFSDSDYFKCNI